MASNGTQSSAQFCASCGARLSGVFCSACGASTISQVNRSQHTSPQDAATATMVAEAPTQTIPLQMPTMNGHAPFTGDEPPVGRRRRGLIISACCAALALVAAGAFAVIFLTGGDDSASRSRTALLDAGRGAQPALSAATGASHLADVQSVARLAGAQQERMATLLGTASTIGDKRYLRTTSATLRAERALLRDLASLSTVSETNLDAWSSIKGSLQRDSLALSEARPAVVALHLHAALPLTLSAGTANKAISSLDHVIGHADQALTTWRSQTQAAHARNHRAMTLTVSCANTMRGYLSRYDSRRGDMGDWVQKVDTEGATFDEAVAAAQSGLEAQITARQKAVRNHGLPPKPAV